MARSDEVFESSIVPGLAGAGLFFTSIEDLDASERARVLGVFEKEIFPVLTPLAVDPGASVPLHLEPLAQPGRARRGPQHPRAAVRAGEGAAAAAPFRAPGRR